MFATPALLSITLPLFVDAVGRELKQSTHISSNGYPSKLGDINVHHDE
jgi:hypothetical protein